MMYTAATSVSIRGEHQSNMTNTCGTVNGRSTCILRFSVRERNVLVCDRFIQRGIGEETSEAMSSMLY